MKDFIYAALPWIIMGLTIAVLALKFSKANSKKDNEIVDKSNMDDKKKLIIISKMIKQITIWQLGCVLECALE